MKRFRMPQWLLYCFWAVFVNACAEWLINPLVEDFAIYGVIAVILIIMVWFTSIPNHSRRRFVSFTIFSLLLGQGLSSVSFYPWTSRIPLSVLIILGLVTIACWFGRVQVLTALFATVVLFFANNLLPVSEWTFLTHFSVSYYGRISIDPTDLTAVPYSVIDTANGGHSLIMLERLQESNLALQEAGRNAVNKPDALINVLRNVKHRYTFLELQQQNGKFSLTSPKSTDLAKINPINMANSVFPFIQAYWSVENRRVIQYMAPAFTPGVLTQIASDPATISNSVLQMSQATESAEMQNWVLAMNQMGVIISANELSITHGMLSGKYDGATIHVPVHANAVVGYGSFTTPHMKQVLISGPNTLQVVSLEGKGQVISTYHGTLSYPLPNDVRVGPIDKSGTDVIFVNSSPAYIIKPQVSNEWKILYTVHNLTFRFEGSAFFGSDVSPEIITDDPSYLRDSPLRYFTSYTYRSGQLVRNWRVYHTNVVNVTPVQFTSNGPEYIVLDIYSTGKFLILRRHDLPIVPSASIILMMIVVIGWFRRVKGSRGGTERDA